MTVRVLTLGLLIAVTAAGMSAVAAQETGRRPVVGATAPDFTLSSVDGQEVRLTSMIEQGPVVILMLRGWVGYQCPICVRQVGEFMGRIRDFQAAGVNILAVYPGPEEGLEEYAKDFVRGETLPENFHLLIDGNYAFTNLYGLRWDAPGEHAYPATFLIDPTGTIQFARISEDYGGRAGAEEILALLR